MTKRSNDASGPLSTRASMPSENQLTHATYQDVEAAFRGSGLCVRGGLIVESDADGPGASTATKDMSAFCFLPPDRAVVLVGNVADGLWPHFPEAADWADPHPLDTWSASVAGRVAERLNARLVMPNDQPYAPFQRWAQRCEPVTPSPLGLLIHPQHGLWHAYRAALIFSHVPAGLPLQAELVSSPCVTCSGQPCLSACPVSAFGAGRFNVDACAGHLRTDVGEATCLAGGCAARAACPVGQPYGPDQTAFHMAAFHRERLAAQAAAQSQDHAEERVVPGHATMTTSKPPDQTTG